MEASKLLKHVDHTLLKQTATAEELKGHIDDGIQYGVAAVCIPPCYTEFAKEYAKGRVPICTVVGFPNGYMTKEVKVFETREYIRLGADEIDMVMNINALKNKQFDAVADEIKAVKAAAGDRILKVIIEACLLNQEEKIQMCKIISSAGGDYIKTSTGFSTGGATFEDIQLFAENVSNGVKIKAAGGIGSLEDGERFLALGCDRLGTSRIVQLVKGDSGAPKEY